MKKLILMALSLLFIGSVNAQTMKVVVNSRGQAVGRYVRTNAKTYTVEGQDEGTVSKAGHKIVIYSAAKGQGVLTLKNPGTVAVYAKPSNSSNTVTKIVYYDGEMPECYNCLGKVNGWYKVKANGKVGYVRANLMTWDGICTF